jgi:hypothetical protein
LVTAGRSEAARAGPRGSLTRILAAHGGMNRWNGYEKVDATIVSGGGFFPLKGVPQDSNPRRMTVWLHEERSSVSLYGAPDQRTIFTPDRIAIEKLDGTLAAERLAPRDSFAGHQLSTPLSIYYKFANEYRKVSRPQPHQPKRNKRGEQ